LPQKNTGWEILFPSTGRQLRLTSYRPDSPFWAGALPVLSGRRGHIRGDGPFLETILPPWKVCYRYGKGAGELETIDYLEFIARVTSHIPDKGQVMVRYHGLYVNAHRGKIKKASLAVLPLRIIEDDLRRIPAKGWAEMTFLCA